MSSSGLKALHVYRTYFPDPPGGLQEAIRQFCLGTSLQGGVHNRVFALSTNPDPAVISRTECDVVREKSLVAPASCDIGGFNSVKTFSDQSKWSDIVHYHFPWPFQDLLSELVRPDRPEVMTYHSDIVRQKLLGAFYNPLMWRMLRRMKIIIATSQNYANTSQVLKHPDIRGKVRVIPLGIDEHSYPSNGDSGIFSKLGLINSEPYFLFVGVLRYYKGIHTLIEAAKSVDAKIVIAGTGPEEEPLRALSKKLGLKSIIFAGFVSDAEKVSLIKSCRALILPSHLRSEAFGMVLIEAAMFSRPMISCEIGTGTSFVNLHDETGFVVPPENPLELNKGLSTLLRNENLAADFGIAARRRYESLFSGEALGRAYSKIYEELM